MNLRFGLILAVGMYAGAAWAAEAVDTRTIATLTPVEARQLVAERQGGSLDLSGLTTLSPETAAVLAEFAGDALVLAGLTTLSPEVAAALTGYKGDLYLWGLTTLSVETAAVLAACKSKQLILDGLPAISPEVARHLAAFKGERLFLDGLEKLPIEAAAEVARFAGGDIYFEGLSEMPADVAKVLATFKGYGLHLNGLVTLSPEAAAALAAFGGKVLTMRSLARLEPEAAEALRGFSTAGLYLGGRFDVEVLDIAMARLLAHAQSLDGCFSLPGVTGFDSPDSVEIAEILAVCHPTIEFPNLKRISPRTLVALVKNENVLLPDVDTLEIIPEPDGSGPGIADDFVLPDEFQKKQRQLRQSLPSPD